MSPSIPMIFRDGNTVIVQGAVTIDHAVMLTKSGIALFDDQPLRIDLDQVTEVDSTIVSILLEWQRATRKNSHVLQFINMPESLKSLIQLYGVAELIPLAVNPVPVQNAS
ncbi:phospholipid transport system transporter-binding protein [Nitrosomonas oligotropha]|uniref:Phospholipid transport system transporter-binding protein n=1 Tax=Nitrosomonas oligotropha TaxID=42354 RepID=A0A2T5H726_9PROT|nr:STAS domain-containing protein [Nitrosomonas oligotropha]PTQ67375.1 phospholipid transport system transporter-binding protein [Nitrosomonas oligotropha]